MADRYEPKQFEAKWRERWASEQLFRTRELPDRPKFYGLDFFPYPSGAGLSVGHCRNYVPTDVICRMKVMQGFNVLHPMGFDAFGLPAENEAIKRQSHPAPMIEQYAANYRRQMELIGISYDWFRSFKSSDPEYYKWTQWIFNLLFERGLAYQKMAAVNWDPIDKTVLADEEVIAGRAERSGAIVEKKYIPQWFFRITEYAQALIDDLDRIDWPEGIKNQQRNWIGRSEGVQFTLRVAGTGRPATAEKRLDLDAEDDLPVPALTFDVFTTRIDTVFGMTFCVLAPEHALVEALKARASEADRAAIEAYQLQAKLLSDTDRTAENREKTGTFTGSYAVNPANGKPVPIYIADYVLATYGTGAIMAVPAHDERDFAFAQKYGIDVVPVISPNEDGTVPELPFAAKEGTLIHSGEYDGLSVPAAQKVLGEWLEANGIGERKVQYRLRDWLISRQRYWGCPIPILHTKEGEMQTVPTSALPVELPDVEHYEPSGDGTSPLAHIEEFMNATDRDGRLARRESDTMGGFACSSWYFLRFCDPHNERAAFDPKRVNYWMPVDCYVGGAEHAVMHLLYARFWTKVLHDAGLVDVKEPFQRLQNQGQVLALTPYRRAQADERLEVGEEGVRISFAEAKGMDPDEVTWRWARMSKSKGNVVTPDEMVESYGADALRVYLLFVAPFSTDIEWKNEGVESAARFLSRVFKLIEGIRPGFEPGWRGGLAITELDEAARGIRRLTHQTIANCTADIERFSFNTYISWLMKYLNGLNDALPVDESTPVDVRLALSEAAETFVKLLSPAAPHSADELWESLGFEGFTFDAAWPVSDPELAAVEMLTIAVQVNGKLRDTFSVAPDAVKEEYEKRALGCDKVQPHLAGKSVRKVIVVPGKLVNLVVSES